MPRTSFAVLLDRIKNRTYEATVDRVGESVLSFEYIPGVQPNFTVDEFYEIDEAMRTDAQGWWRVLPLGLISRGAGRLISRGAGRLISRRAGRLISRGAGRMALWD